MFSSNLPHSRFYSECGRFVLISFEAVEYDQSLANIYSHKGYPKLCRAGAPVPAKGKKNMQVDLIFKIAAIGILVAVLNMLLSKAGRDDQALLCSIAGLVVVLMIILEEISSLFDTVKTLFGL